MSVAAGETVTFTNLDTAPHTATADDASFDTESLGQDESGDLTFDEPGTYPYFCVFHPFMKGTIEVE